MGWFHNVKMSWYRVFQENTDGLVKSRRNLFAGNVTNTVVSALTAGTFYTTLLLILFRGHPDSLRNEYIGNIAMLQTAAGFLQMAAPLILERMRTRKAYLISMYTLYYMLDIVGLSIVPILPLDIIPKANIFMIICALRSIINALMAPGVSAWHIHPIRQDIRSDYFALNSMITGMVSNLVAMVVGVIMDFAAVNEKEYMIIMIARGIAVLLVFVLMRKWSKVEEPEYIIGEKRPSMIEILTTPLRHPLYLLNVLVISVWTMGNATIGSYYGTYILSDGGVSYTLISATNLFALPIALIVTPLWNQVVRRFGWMKIMSMGMFLYGITFVFNGLVTKETTILYLLGSIYCCSVSPSYSLGASNMSYFNLPKQGQSSCLAFYCTINSIASFVGAWIGKEFMKATEGKVLHLFGLELTNGATISFLPFFFLSGAAILAFIVYCINRRVEKKQEQNVQA